LFDLTDLLDLPSQSSYRVWTLQNVLNQAAATAASASSRTTAQPEAVCPGGRLVQSGSHTIVTFAWFARTEQLQELDAGLDYHNSNSKAFGRKYQVLNQALKRRIGNDPVYTAKDVDAGG
jgi:hypothetical protein